ncbi:hypothetical protein HanHA300_Chr05g0173671 [Helianthus annuus]|nr:hypothetical protein HanHA300_Chr05g0173671 [Helianthus annuus]KAJ0584385.1 hypothetical protein HanHA89_Chr05g0187961 [Helianthus annuus]
MVTWGIYRLPKVERGWSIEWQPDRVVGRSSGSSINRPVGRLVIWSISHLVRVFGATSLAISVATASVAMQ